MYQTTSEKKEKANNCVRLILQEKKSMKQDEQGFIKSEGMRVSYEKYKVILYIPQPQTVQSESSVGAT